MIEFEHGGPKITSDYPEGIPTSLVITDGEGKAYDSGLVMYPAGHARNTTADREGILAHKFGLLGGLGLPDAAAAQALIDRLEKLGSMNAGQVAGLYDFPIASRPGYE